MRIPSFPARTAALVAALSLGAAGASAQQATFHVLGAGDVADMSPDGAAVVGRDNQGAFLWTAAGGLRPLGQLDAVAVSDDGTVVLGNMIDPVSGNEVAGRWTAATGWISLGGIGGVSGTSESSAYGMSGDGSRATGLAWVNANTAKAFEWTQATGMLPLTQLGPNSTRGNCVSANGTFIGGWDEDPTGPRRAAIWNVVTGVEQLILQSPSNLEGIGEVQRLSSNGEFAVGPGTNFEAYRWSAATGVTPIFIGTPGFFDRNFALGVSDDGGVVVGAAGQPPFGLQALYWTPAGGAQYLRDVLVAGGASEAANWDLASAVDVSADGRVILGAARPVGGFALSWFVATLDHSIGSSFCGPAVASSSGQPGVIAAYGLATVGHGDLLLRATRLPANAFGYFLVSNAQGTVTPAGSQGTLCLSGGIGRFSQPGQVGNAGAGGAIGLAVDLGALPRPGGLVPVVAGETWHFQAWFRDANPHVTSNFTDAVSVTFG